MPDVQYFGLSAVRLRGRDGIVLCDPFDRSAGMDMGRPTAHIVTISHAHPHHNATGAVRPVRDDIFVIDGPGEYEVHGVLITGTRTRPDAGTAEERGFNTVYIIHLDDVVFCHLGYLSHELTQSQLEDIGNIDVLFVPVGDGGTLTPAEAINVIGQIEPRIVIPIYYAIDRLSDEYALTALEKFTNEIGAKDVTPEEKLSVTPSSLPAEGEETRILVITPGAS
ncbi:MAG: MBL fold metallo-hydrolase [Chloroflexaceae bacterium]|nr:MBL fold metallo-hydrolase [Chloroflexaceae bacterium]NJO04151.1 MBL fold metallo-hydrolase [Chloroflexaceae bacterium]